MQYRASCLSANPEGEHPDPCHQRARPLSPKGGVVYPRVVTLLSPVSAGAAGRLKVGNPIEGSNIRQQECDKRFQSLDELELSPYRQRPHWLRIVNCPVRVPVEAMVTRLLVTQASSGT